MKLAVFLVLFFSFQSFAFNGWGQDRVSLNIKKASFEQVIRKIEEKTSYRFVYDNSIIPKGKQIDLKVDHMPIHQVLSQLLKGTSLSYQWRSSNLIILVQEKKSIQTLPVIGKVIEKNGTPLANVSILEKGTNNGTTSLPDGSFKIDVKDENAVLIISLVGYEEKEVSVKDKEYTTIVLEAVINELDEVITVAYGQKQRKIATLGAQSTVNVAELKQPVANLSTVLAGRISGLIAVQRTGEPGLDGANLWIRGINTFSNTSPLILVDGVERSFDNLDPNDIESFAILKDASATSVYGVRGANGVIIITTKKGVASTRPVINLEYNQGITEFTRVPEVVDGITYMQVANEANVTRGNAPIYSEERIRKTATGEDPYLYPDVDWFKEIFNRFGNNQKANLNIRGGGEKMNYYVSAGYYNEKGLFKTDGLRQYNSEIAFKRYNFTSSLSVKATKTTTIDLGVKGWITNGNYPGSGTQTIFNSVFNTYPILYPVLYPDGSEPFVSTGGGLNSPYGLLTNRGYVTTYGNQLLSDINLKQQLDFITEGLSARILYSFDAQNSNRLARYKTPYTYYATGRDDAGELILERTDNGNGRDYLSFERTNGGSRQFYLESAINYDRTFGKHSLTGLFLYNQSDYISATASDLIGSIPYRKRGIVGRVSYSYDDRYLSEVSFGYNGAENFAPDKRYGLFPSVALGWVPSNEQFWKDHLSEFIQLFKIRGSYGIVGSGDISGRRFAYIATVEGTSGFSFGKDRGNFISGLDIGDYAANVTWETEKNANIGIELAFLRRAVNLQVDLYNRRRENIFLQRASVPASTGLRSNLLGNLGITNARGIDVSGDFKKNFGQLGLTARGTFTYSKNEVVENDQPEPPYPYQERRGHLINQRFGYIAEGFYTQEEIEDPNVAKTAGIVQAGDLKYKDLNGDGVIDGDDQTAIGLTQDPQIVYGFGLTAAYKGFSLGAFFQGVSRVQFYMATDFMPFREGSTKGTLYGNIGDRWTEDDQRQDAFYPRLSYGDINQNYSATSSHWIQDGQFLRLKTIDFGYTFRKGTLSRLGVDNCRLYFVGYNILTFSPFKMFDPELGSGTGGRYPNIKTYSLGVNLTF